MKLIIGIGNPGKDYENTRHNAGYLFVDELQKNKLPADVVVKKSDVFMNDSGGFVSSQYTKYKTPNTNLYIAHDDLDIKLGEYKIQFGKGPKDHNGLNDVYDKLGTQDFWHIRIGVDNRPLDDRPLGIGYVLQEFGEEERKILDKTIKAACHELAQELSV